ncbi:hypothetical protein NKH99_28210, partial [Mesorhizobium sp. M0854]|uniref:hypothetical protein n=1 Tax=Mesorhizobium sp. M0854 TaxID=2957013 RepID=UPI00333A9042
MVANQSIRGSKLDADSPAYGVNFARRLTDWRWHQKALGQGCIFSINPDAHSIRELDHMHWGVEMARKGGVPAKRVLNASV